MLNNTTDDTAAGEILQNVGKEDVSQIMAVLKGLTFVDSPLVFSGKLVFFLNLKEELFGC